MNCEKEGTKLHCRGCEFHGKMHSGVNKAGKTPHWCKLYGKETQPDTGVVNFGYFRVDECLEAEMGK